MTLPSPLTPVQPASRIYVLRLWKEGADGRAWRASLYGGPGTARRHFATLDALVEHLFSEMTRL